jgi:hypothetical protein
MFALRKRTFLPTVAGAMFESGWGVEVQLVGCLAGLPPARNLTKNHTNLINNRNLKRI